MKKIVLVFRCRQCGQAIQFGLTVTDNECERLVNDEVMVIFIVCPECDNMNRITVTAIKPAGLDLPAEALGEITPAEVEEFRQELAADRLPF